MELSQAINYYFKGDKINQTEKRAVLHTALRAKQDDVVLVDGVNVIPEIYSVKEKIKSFSENLINGNYKGYTGKNITDVVNIVNMELLLLFQHQKNYCTKHLLMLI